MFQQLVSQNPNLNLLPADYSAPAGNSAQWMNWNFCRNCRTDEALTQQDCKMKLRKQTKTVARSGNVVGMSMPATDRTPSLNLLPPRAPISADPGPLEFDSPEEIAFRNFIKSQLPRLKAPADLSEKIRHAISKD